MTEIRKATIEDLKFVVELFDKYRVFYEKKSDIVKAEEYISKRLKLNDSQIFVAETDNKNLIGFVQLYPIFSSIRMQQLWLLNDLFVDKKYLIKRIGKSQLKQGN